MNVYLTIEQCDVDSSLPIWVQSGQNLTIGRTHDADVVVADSTMSSTHFRLECNGSGCKLRDLESCNGTKLNGEPIGEASLRNGDQIVAGTTQFSVRFDTIKDDPKLDRTIVPASHIRHRPSPKPALRCSSKTLDNELICLGSDDDSVRPLEVLESLGTVTTVFALVDFSRLELECPEVATPIFTWLPESIQREASPAFLPVDSIENRKELFEKGWGKNAIVLFCSLMEHDTVSEHLSLVVQNRHTQDTAPEPPTVLGICWPKTIGSLLANCSTQMVEALMYGIDAVMVENGNSWKVYGKREFVQQQVSQLISVTDSSSPTQRPVDAPESPAVSTSIL